MTEKKYNFFNPVFSTSPPTKALGGFGVAQVPALTKSFPINLGAFDLTNLSKNTGKFEELATSFGLQTLHETIMKNTLRFSTTEIKKPTPAGPKMPTSAEKAPNFVDTQSNPNDVALTIVGTSALGFPVYSNLSIQAGNYQNNDGVTVAEFNDVRVDACIFEISRENNVVETDIQGRDNSIIEYISGKSWKINCKGRILSKTRNAYPLNEANNLILALNSNRSLRINSFFLGMAGIYNIVIKKKTIPQEEGGLEYQKFEFDAIADNPVVLKLTK